MTTEEAINLLDPICQKEALKKRGGGWIGVSAINEALEMAVTALRAQQAPAKLGRSRWKGCEHCIGDLEGYTSCFRDANGRSRKIYIPEGEAAIVVPGKYNHKLYIPIKFCPFCGRPLTEEAWAELERRISP